MTAIPSSSRGSPGRIRLAGSVAGIDACEIVSDQSAITVGASPACDLCVPDPLIARRAFTIRRASPARAASGSPADGWLIDAAAGARVYVNDELARRVCLAFGDTICTGCHRFVFAEASGRPRNFRSATNVADVCGQLLAGAEIPVGYLHGTPGWQSRHRLRVAGGVAGALALAAAFVVWLLPRDQFFEQVQPPLEVVMVSDRALAPEPTEVRSMKDVVRQTVKMPAEGAPAPELAARPLELASSLREPNTQPLPEVAAPNRPSPAFPAIVTSAGTLEPAPVESEKGVRLAVVRPAQRIAASAPARRLSVSEAADPAFSKELAQHQIQLNPEALRAVAAVQMSGKATAGVRPPSTNIVLRSDPARVTALVRYEASPLAFEKVSGARVPVARLPGRLAEMEVKGAPASIVLDGAISDAEIAMCWKSGQFRANANGNPPPFGDPPTYCYVGKADLDGKPFLYVSFVCMDPNVGAIIDTYDGVWRGVPPIIRDDSIEIFLDVNFDRADYDQLIVNTSGKYWGVHYRNYLEVGAGAPWDPKPRIKTTINKDAGRWTCEVMIPFDQLGGVPAKGVRWSVNFCRNYRGQDRTDHNLQNWFLVYDANRKDMAPYYYHNPDRFGVFQW